MELSEVFFFHLFLWVWHVVVLSFSSVSVINFVVVHNLVNSLIVILVTIETLLLISVAHVSCVYYTTLPQVPKVILYSHQNFLSLTSFTF